MMRGAVVMGAVFSIGIFGCSPPDGAAGSEANSAAGGIESAVMTINQDDYARRLGVIAHDSMSGRFTPSPGLDATANCVCVSLTGLLLARAARRLPAAATRRDLFTQ